MKKPVLYIAGLFVAIVAAVVGYLLQQHNNRLQEQPKVVYNAYVKPEKNLIGEIRPVFILQDMNGTQRNVQEWDGKILVLNFWATWCPPCRDEIPAFVKLQDKYQDQGLQFVGVALQTADEIRDYVAEMGMNYPSLVGAEDVIKVAKSLGNHFGTLPYTVIIDRNQRIAFIKSGPLHYDDAEAVIRALLSPTG